MYIKENEIYRKNLFDYSEKQSEEIEELKEELNSCEFVNKLVNNHYIPKQKIKDKDKELNKMIKQYYKHKDTRFTLNEIQAIKSVLKELL